MKYPSVKTQKFYQGKIIDVKDIPIAQYYFNSGDSFYNSVNKIYDTAVREGHMTFVLIDLSLFPKINTLTYKLNSMPFKYL